MEKSNHENEILPALSFSQNSTNSNLHSTEPANIQCLQCNCVYQFPADKDDYLAHLFLEHRLVIADVEDIPLLEDYLIFWLKEFTG